MLEPLPRPVLPHRDGVLISRQGRGRRPQARALLRHRVRDRRCDQDVLGQRLSLFCSCSSPCAAGALGGATSPSAYPRSGFLVLVRTVHRRVAAQLLPRRRHLPARALDRQPDTARQPHRRDRRPYLSRRPSRSREVSPTSRRRCSPWRSSSVASPCATPRSPSSGSRCWRASAVVGVMFVPAYFDHSHVLGGLPRARARRRRRQRCFDLAPTPCSRAFDREEAARRSPRWPVVLIALVAAGSSGVVVKSTDLRPAARRPLPGDRLPGDRAGNRAKWRCVLSDAETVLVSADRASPSRRGCPAIGGATGTWLSFDPHIPVRSGIGPKDPALVALWQQAFSAADYVVISTSEPSASPWTRRCIAAVRSAYVAPAAELVYRADRLTALSQPLPHQKPVPGVPALLQLAGERRVVAPEGRRRRAEHPPEQGRRRRFSDRPRRGLSTAEVDHDLGVDRTRRHSRTYDVLEGSMSMRRHRSRQRRERLVDRSAVLQGDQ